MEEKEETSSEFEGEEGAESFRVEPRTENAKQIDGPAMVVTLPAATALPTSAAVPGMKVSKKRGRPRKAGRGGVALSPMPISASIPLNGEFSAWERGKGASVDTVMKKHKVKHESPGKGFAYFVDANFTPHVLIVNPGCHDEGYVILSTRISSYLCSLCLRYNFKCITLSAYFLWGYFNIRGLLRNSFPVWIICAYHEWGNNQQIWRDECLFVRPGWSCYWGRASWSIVGCWPCAGDRRKFLTRSSDGTEAEEAQT
ncbi:AT-hook motif nuclear-localized protein 3 isoform X2 [Syzygium oleosum]|uniref:AT-hook motif nuclear-localized protein 3 isoform X2 n=1 Tax=Syzygium oleosum TaxID=219896 RepID=UPI0024BA73F0|nr:AT-hook motif nuclear-localized protein 3 isoform X2 [Syzygium oleosum]